MNSDAGDTPDAADLGDFTPAGKATVDYAIELLRSIHPSETHSAEQWLLAHPGESVPALVAALHTQSAQAAAVLLGLIGDPNVIEALLEAYQRGGEGLRSAVETALRSMQERGSQEAATALSSFAKPPD